MAFAVACSGRAPALPTSNAVAPAASPRDAAPRDAGTRDPACARCRTESEGCGSYESIGCPGTVNETCSMWFECPAACCGAL